MQEKSDQPAECGGVCAFAVSLGKTGPAGKDGVYKIENGKKYLFVSPVARMLWNLMPGRREKAHEKWAAR